MQPAMIELPPPTGKLIGALQVLRANTDHHDSAAGQAAIDKALAAVRSYGEACARAALEAAAREVERMKPYRVEWSDLDITPCIGDVRAHAANIRALKVTP
jgi:hypothetical protein